MCDFFLINCRVARKTIGSLEDKMCERLPVENCQDIIKELEQDPPVVLLGAAISQWDPVLFSAGETISQNLIKLLFESCKNIIIEKRFEKLEEILKNTPFEHLCEACPDKQSISETICEYFKTDYYNPIHKALSDALIEGKISSLLTTNYDCCFENAFEDKLDMVTKVVTNEDLEKPVQNNSKYYFKIHGCIKNPETLMFSLKQERLLSKPKRDFLRKLIENKNLLIIGYSGLDFDICIELLQFPIKNIYWNNLKQEIPSVNSCNVLKIKNGTLLYGDMRTLIKSIIPQMEICTKDKSGRKSFEKILAEKIAIDEMNQWTVNILNSIGIYPDISWMLIDLFLKDKNKYRASSMFFMGKYYSSGMCYCNCANGILPAYDAQKIEYLLNASDSFRCCGSFLKAGRALKKAEEGLKQLVEEENKELFILFKLKKSLLVYNIYQLLKIVPKFKSSMKATLIEDFQYIAGESLKIGNWFYCNQANLWLDRLNVNRQYSGYENFYMPSPKDGYKHINYHMAQNMVVIDGLKQDIKKLSPAEDDELDKKIEVCDLVGDVPNLWKLFLIKSFRSRNSRFLAFKGFLKNFFKCEYILPMRFFVLIVNIPKLSKKKKTNR
jgi:hypothetical protein